jgi:hypothetical protein
MSMLQLALVVFPLFAAALLLCVGAGAVSSWAERRNPPSRSPCDH